MAYQVLARKYRPKVFEEIVGQPHASVSLKNAVTRDKVSHAYLFSGPRGVGKTSTARILAKALNCPKPSNGNPCNKCEVCGAVDRGLFMDVFEIDAASNRGIDEVRDLREKVKYPPQLGRYKVYIVDEVHMLTDYAFNAFLKTLEEPPSHVVFIFATTEAHRIPQTILSRCQRYDFRRIHVKDIVLKMEDVLKKEGYPGDDLSEEVVGVLHIIARRVDGSLRDALSLLDQVLSFGDGTIVHQALEGVLGRVDEELYLELARILQKREAAEVFPYVQGLLDNGADLDEFYYGLVDHIRSMILFRIGGDAWKDLEYPSHVVKEYENLAKGHSLEDLMRMARIVEREEYAFKTSHQRRFALETLLLRLVLLDRTVQLSELMEKLNQGSGKMVGSRGGVEKKTRARLSKGKIENKEKNRNGDIEVNKEEGKVRAERVIIEDKEIKSQDQVRPQDAGDLFGVIKDSWGQITTEIKARKVSLGNFLSSAQPMGLDGGSLVLGVGDGMRDFISDQLKIASNLRLIFEVIADLVGKKVSLSLEVREMEEGEGAGVGNGNETFNEEQIESNGTVLLEKVKNLFDAEIVREE